MSKRSAGRLAGMAVILAAGISQAAEWKDLPRRTAEFYDADGAHGIPLHVDEPSGVDRIAFPVSGGIPFPKGALDSADHVRILDPQKREISCQVKVASRWMDDSVRWLLVDFQADVKANTPATYFLEYGPKVTRAKPQKAIAVTETASDVTIDTGVLKFVVAKGRGSLLEDAWLDANKDSRYDDAERIMSGPAEVFLDLKDLGTETLAKSEPSVEPGEIGVWQFRTDPKDVGVKESWFAEGAPAEGWKRILTGHYENQVNIAYDGYSWYRAAFAMPADVKGREVRIVFGGIDDFGWVYVNGTPAGGNFEAEEGKTRYDTPLEVKADPLLKFGQRNVLTVRVFDPKLAGGIWKKVFVEYRDGEQWKKVPITCEAIQKEQVASSFWPAHDMSGRYTIANDKESRVEIETSGPERVALKVTGWHRNASGEPFAMYTLRIHAFAGSPELRVFHTFVFTGAPLRFRVESIGLSQKLRLGDGGRYAFGAPAKPVIGPIVAGHQYSLYQRNEELKKWPKFDQWRPRFRILDTQGAASAEVADGELAEGWADLSDGQKGCSVLIRNAWQQVPKGFTIEGDRLTTWLWPPQAGQMDLRNTTQRMPDDFREFLKSEEGRLWYQDPPEVLQKKELPWLNTAIGMAKTHELVIGFHGPDNDASHTRTTARSFETPSLVFVTPAWYADSDVLGRFHPYDPGNFPQIERRQELLVQWLLKHQREWFHWYGMLDYGCFQYAYDAKEDRWRNYTIKTGWQNMEVEQCHAVFIQYLRTGKREYYDLAEAMARHSMDVDSPHYLPNRPADKWGGGGRHNTDHWGNRLQSGAHIYPFGLRDYYWLAGYDRALDVLKEIASAQDVLNMKELVIDRNTWHGLKNPFAEWEITRDGKTKAKMEQNLAVVLADMKLRVDSSGQIVHVNGGDPFRDWMFNEYLPATLHGYLVLVDDPTTAERYLAMIDTLLGTAQDVTYSSERYPLAYRLTKNPAFAKAAVALLRKYQSDQPVPVTPARSEFQFSGTLCNSHTAIPYLMAVAYDAKVGHPSDPARPEESIVKPVLYDLVSRETFTPRAGYAFVPLSIRSAANACPLSLDPFGLRGKTGEEPPEPDLKLRPGEIGFDFGFGGNVAAGFLPVTPSHLYPSQAWQPMLVGDLGGFPFGGVTDFCGVPFDLPPALTGIDKAFVVLGPNERVHIPVNRAARAVHFLGHVCGTTTARNIEGAKYVIHFVDGTRQEVTLVSLVDYQPTSVPFHYCAKATFARKVSGYPPGVQSPQPIATSLNVFSVEVPEKEIAEIEFVDTGAGHRPALLGVTLEAQQAQTAPPAFDKTFTFKTIETYDETRGCGWRGGADLAVNPPDAVRGKGSATFACKVPDGDYDLILDVAGRDADDYLSLDVNGVPKFIFAKPLTTLRTSVAASAAKGVLDVTLRARRCRGATDCGGWILKSIRIRSRSEPVPQPPPLPAASITYGWQPGPPPISYGLNNLMCMSTPDRKVKDKLFGDCVTGQPFQGPQDITFNVDLPNGSYEADGYVFQRGGAILRLDGYAEGQPQFKSLAIKEPPAGGWGPVKKITMKATVGDGQLNLRFVLDPDTKSEYFSWGFQALVLRNVER